MDVRRSPLPPWPKHPLPPHVAVEGQPREHVERLVSAALSHDGSWGTAGESCPCPPWSLSDLPLEQCLVRPGTS